MSVTSPSATPSPEGRTRLPLLVGRGHQAAGHLQRLPLLRGPVRRVPRPVPAHRAERGRRQPAGQPVPRLPGLLRRLHVHRAARVRPQRARRADRGPAGGLPAVRVAGPGARAAARLDRPVHRRRGLGRPVRRHRGGPRGLARHRRRPRRRRLPVPADPRRRAGRPDAGRYRLLSAHRRPGRPELLGRHGQPQRPGPPGRRAAGHLVRPHPALSARRRRRLLLPGRRQALAGPPLPAPAHRGRLRPVRRLHCRRRRPAGHPRRAASLRLAVRPGHLGHHRRHRPAGRLRRPAAAQGPFLCRSPASPR